MALQPAVMAVIARSERRPSMHSAAIIEQQEIVPIEAKLHTETNLLTHGVLQTLVPDGCYIHVLYNNEDSHAHCYRHRHRHAQGKGTGQGQAGVFAWLLAAVDDARGNLEDKGRGVGAEFHARL